MTFNLSSIMCIFPTTNEQMGNYLNQYDYATILVIQHLVNICTSVLGVVLIVNYTRTQSSFNRYLQSKWNSITTFQALESQMIFQQTLQPVLLNAEFNHFYLIHSMFCNINQTFCKVSSKCHFLTH